MELALQRIGFAEILAHLRVIRIHRHRLQIVADAFVGAAEFARRVAAIIEGARRVGILEQIERLQRLLVAFVGLVEREGVLDDLRRPQEAAKFIAKQRLPLTSQI